MKKFLSCFILFFGLLFAVVGCGDKTVYHTVSFETDGLISLQSQRVADGELATEPRNINKEGYNFIGWFADSQFQSEFDFFQPIKSNTTIYAKFEKIEIEITFAQVVSGVEIVEPTEKTYYGDDYHFSILIEERFNQSEPYASMNSVLANVVSSEIITEEGNNKGKRKIDFCFENIKANGTILIDGISSVNSYSIKLPANQVGYQLTSNVLQVNYNGDATLTLKIDEKYNQSIGSFAVVINKGEETEKDITSNFQYDSVNDIFVCTERVITNNVEITVDGIEINKFEVENISQKDNDGESFTLEWIEGVENGIAIIGSIIKFKLTYHPYYNQSETIISLKMGDQIITPTLVPESENKNIRVYKIENVDGNITNFVIDKSKIVKNIYSIKLPENTEGYVLNFMNNRDEEREAGSKVEIRIIKYDGYDFSDAKITYLDKEYDLKDMQFITINALEDNVEFSVSGVEPILFNINMVGLPINTSIVNQTGFYKETIQVLKTETYSFELSFAEGYELGTIKVFNKGIELVAEEGVYSVLNVSEDIKITFSGDAKLKEYDILLNEGEGFSVESWVSKLTHGTSGDYSIKINLNYTDCISRIEVFANENKLEVKVDSENSIITFSITEIKENTTIYIKNIERNKVQVTYIDFDDCAEDYYLEDEAGNVFKESVEVNKKYYLYLTLKSEYQNDRAGITLSYNGNKQSYNSCIFNKGLNRFVCLFTIYIINSDIALTLSGFVKNVYDVTLEDKSDSPFYHYSINLLESSNNKVVHGENVEFEIVIDENYEAKVDYSDLVTVQTIKGEFLKALYDEINNKYIVENVQDTIVISIGYYEDEDGEQYNKIDFIKYSLSIYVDNKLVGTVNYNSGSAFLFNYSDDYTEVTEWQSDDVDLNCIKKSGSVYSKTVINKEYEITLYYDLDEEVKKITYLDCKKENGEYYYVLQNLPSVEGRIFIGWKLLVYDELVEMEKNEINFSDIANNSIVLVATWNILKPNNNLSYKSDNYIIFSIGYNSGDFADNFEAEYNWYIIEENGEKTQILVGKELLQFATLGLQSGTYKIQCEARACYDGSASDWVQSEIYEITI